MKLAALTSLLCKGGNILLQIVAIPMALSVLGAEAFGVFALISTLITFVILSELGVGPGLTNILTRHIAAADKDAASRAFSSAFYLTAALASAGCLLVVGAVLLAPVDTLFGPRFLPYADPLRQGVILGVGIVFLRMIGSLGDRARAAYQQTFVTNLYGAAANVTAGLTLILGLPHFPAIWFIIAVVNGALALAGLLNLAHLWLQHPHLWPRLSRIDPRLSAFLIRDGLAFCATLSLAPLAKDLGLRVILGHLGGPAAVAVFDILERLFVFAFGFVVMFTFPLWPALSDAAARGDFPWIRTARRRLYLLAAAGSLAFTVGLVLFGPWGVTLWLKGELDLPRTLLAAFGLYASVNIWHHVHHIFLAGLDAIRTVAMVVLLEIPLFLVTGYLGYSWQGFPGLFLTLAALGLVAAILFPHLAQRRLVEMERNHSPAPLPNDEDSPLAIAAS